MPRSVRGTTQSAQELRCPYKIPECRTSLYQCPHATAEKGDFRLDSADFENVSAEVVQESNEEDDT